MILWGRSSAFNVQKVQWLLAELGLEFEHRAVGGAYGGLDTPEFRALNPHGRIPVIQDGDVVIWESHAILRYLAARYSRGALWSDDPALRSEFERWMDWSQSSLQPAFMRLFWGYYRTPESRRDPRQVEGARRDCDACFQALDARLAQHDFLAGASFSLADVPAGATLFRYLHMGLEVPRHPHVDAWFARLASREPYRTRVMVPFEDLRGRLEF